MTVVVRRMLGRTVHVGVHTRIMNPIHGGQLILVVQQQSTEWISPIEVTQECIYFVWNFGLFSFLLFSDYLDLFILYMVQVSDVIRLCVRVCVCHSCAGEISGKKHLQPLKDVHVV